MQNILLVSQYFKVMFTYSISIKKTFLKREWQLLYVKFNIVFGFNLINTKQQHKLNIYIYHHIDNFLTRNNGIKVHCNKLQKTKTLKTVIQKLNEQI